jgi:tripartite-type tricarboxylate transporter receptor subunit TctC
LLSQRAGITFNLVPFPGGASAVTALLGGHIAVALTEHAAVSDHIRFGTIRGLAVTTSSRLASLPDVPTVAETYDGYEMDFWWGLFARREAPAAAVRQWEAWSTSAAGRAEVGSRLRALGFTPASLCGPNFELFFRAQDALYGQIIRAGTRKE